MRTANFAVLLAALSLGGCDLLQGEDPAKVAAAREADGKAVGAACRHSGRALEDCYVMNAKALRSAVYAGWLEMDGYMRDNKIPIAVPNLVEPPVSDKAVADVGKAPEAKADTQEEPAKKPAAETKKKASAKRGASFLAPPSTLPRRTT